MLYFIKKIDLKQRLNKKFLIDNSKYLNTIVHFLGSKFNNTLLAKFGVILNSVFGIGYKKYIYFFISLFGLSFNYPLAFISMDVFQKLQYYIRLLFVNYDLKNYVLNSISLQKQMRLLTGVRHNLFLPVRGQRTKTNAGSQKQRRVKFAKAGKGGKRVRKRKEKSKK